MLDGQDSLLLLDVGRDEIMEEEKRFRVRRHVDVIVKVWNTKFRPVAFSRNVKK